MLMLNSEEAKMPALGNFYFSPVRLSPVFQPAYIADLRQQAKLRLKKESKSNQEPSDKKPVSRIDNKNEELDISNSDILTADQSPFVKYEEGGSDTDSEVEKKKRRKSKKRRSKEDDFADSTWEHLCTKLRFSFVLSALGVIILVACCCALFLRNRLVACCRRCWPFGKKKSKNNSNLFDVEGGDYNFISRKKRKKRSPNRMIDTATQDSRANGLIQTEDESQKVGCSPCSKKKKKKNKKRRK